MPDDNAESQNPFLLEELYPDVSNIFNTEVLPVGEIKDDCVVVLDTSALLFPYKVSKDKLEEITKAYKHLVDSSRLIVPAHAAREFVEQRPEHLTDLYQKLSNHLSKYLSNPTNLDHYPLLQSLPEFANLAELETKIKKEVSEMRREHAAAMKGLLAKVRNWRWNDPVSEAYRSLFSNDVIFEPDIDRTQLVKEAKRRKRYNIPPGYKDVRDTKQDNKNLYGDLKIWFTVLEVAKQGKHLIFVSTDEKADWHHQSGGAKLYSRFELLEEYKRASNGKAFYALRLSELLDLYGASSEVVEEVEQEEKSLNDFYSEGELSKVQEAVLNWWRFEEWDGSGYVRSDEFDLDLHSYSEEFLHKTASYIVQIVEVRDIFTFDIPEIRRKVRHLSEAARDHGYNGGKLFVIFDGESDAKHGVDYLSSRPAENVVLYVGYLEGERLELVSTNHN